MKPIISACLALSFATSAFGQARMKPLPPKTPVNKEPAWTTPPKLVVGIVVDQMRVDYIYRYWSNFGEGGFKRLVQDGAFLRNAHYTYIPTVTGPGHASVYTGSVPAHHGIVANDIYDRAARKTNYCVSDPGVQGLGSPGAQSSPHLLLATTLADEIERRTDGKGRTIGIALKDRSSVLPIGRTGDAAYWYSSNGTFVSSSWYMTALPAWLTAFNARELPRKYLDHTWQPLLPLARYHQAMPDSNAYEQELTKGSGSRFPYDLAALSKTAGPGLISATPWGNTLTTDLALEAMQQEQLGKDSITDLLAISYSSTDILGHKMGPRALEVEDMYIRLDQEMARLLNELDKQVGKGSYTLFLTADHGAIDVPAYLKDLKGSAGYVDTRSWKDELSDLSKHGSPLLPSWMNAMYRVDTILEGHIFLPDSARSTDYMMRIAQHLLRKEPVAQVFLGSDMRHGAGLSEQGSTLANGYMPQRCGDILYTLKPGYFEAEGAYLGKGTTHGSGWNYDTHVPVLFFGQGIKPGEVVRRTAVADIAPTIAMIVGCALPDAAVGEPVPEVLR